MADGPPGTEPARWTIAPLPAPPGSVAALVADQPVRAWSADAPLADAPEAWPTAFCLPASRADAVLVSPERVDPTWRSGADANVALAASWWGGTDHLRLDQPRRRLVSRRRPPTRRAEGRAVCFTSGVDSFFTLLRGNHAPTHLLFVIGFDVDEDDAERVATMLATLRAVGQATGTRPLAVTTDLRTHPKFVPDPWQRTHGAALAAIGHLLHPTIGTLVIPPSYGAHRLIPWGSRPDTDPRWSAPLRTVIEHGDASGVRHDRILAIASEPLVHGHLRVCWQNVPGSLNCGRCEKCLRTMVVFAGIDQLQNVVTFPDRAALTVALDDLPAIEPQHLRAWSDFPDLRLRPDERRALEALLARSTRESP